MLALRVSQVPSGRWQPRGLLQPGWLREVGAKLSGMSQESNGRLAVNNVFNGDAPKAARALT